MREVVEKLIDKKITISTMESCTGGGVANEITSIEGASEILKFSAVTYSNEFKIKMGVDANVIDEFSVYSIETANEMSKNISDFTGSILGVGITGKLNRQDVNNMHGSDNTVFVSIYDRDENKYYTNSIEVHEISRELNKKLVIDFVKVLLLEILEKK